MYRIAASAQRLGLATALLALSVAFAAPGFGATTAGSEQSGQEPAAEQQPAGEVGEAAAETGDRITRQGLTVQFSIAPLLGRYEEERELMKGDRAQVSFRITDAESGEPVRGLFPGAWVDLTATAQGGGGRSALNCKERVGLYLKGTTGVRAMVDLNSYFVLAMNQDSTISVIDPSALVAGMQDMYFTQVILKRPGGDWAKTADDKRLFVTMPQGNQVAVIDTESFTVERNIDAGKDPLRAVLQPDGKYLWVGNNAKSAAESGVTVIDAESYEVAAFIPTGTGHHEIAIAAGNRVAFVSNRNSGSVSIIDVATLEKVKDLKTGPAPISLGYSELSKSVYVADGQDGTVSVLDPETQERTSRIVLEPGLGPLRVSPDGRWAFVVNPGANRVYVIDLSTNRVAHEITIQGQPFQVSFTRAFAYVRTLEDPRISLVDLSELGKEGRPPVVAVPAGGTPPKDAGHLSIADGVAEAAGEAGVIVASPGDSTLYFYMEGMNAPLGSFSAKGGHKPVAITVTDRALREGKAGVYSAKLRIPEAGTYDVAFILDSPRILHCFEMTALPSPAEEADTKPLQVEYLVDDRKVTAGATMHLRFRLSDPKSGAPRPGLTNVRVLYYLAPGRRRTQLAARDAGDGIYEAELAVPMPGAYYVYVAAPSEEVEFTDLPFLTLRAVRERTAPASGQTGG